MEDKKTKNFARVYLFWGATRKPILKPCMLARSIQSRLSVSPDTCSIRYRNRSFYLLFFFNHFQILFRHYKKTCFMVKQMIVLLSQNDRRTVLNSTIPVDSHHIADRFDVSAQQNYVAPKWIIITWTFFIWTLYRAGICPLYGSKRVHLITISTDHN